MNEKFPLRAALLLVTGTATGSSAQPTGDVDLAEARQIPAEQTVAAYSHPDWAPPRTSWGHPALAGTWSTDDMRGIPRNRPEALGTQEFLDEAEFLERALTQQTGREDQINNEAFLRNEWGTRTFGFSSLVVDPPDGRTPPLTEAAQARARAAGRGTFGAGPFNRFEDFSYYDRCISLGISPGMRALIYGNGIRVAQSPDAVTITYEMIHETRVIALDGRAPLDGSLEQYTGHSRGHWDGDTLVIETRGFTDRTSVGGASHSRALRTTERIRRVDPEMIEYRITIDDPETYTAPFTVRTMWTTQPDYRVWEYACHEGNHAVEGGLRAERAYERQVAEAIATGGPLPARSTGMTPFTEPPEDVKVIDINRGE